MYSIKQRLLALTVVVAVISAIVLFVSFSTISPIKDDWRNYLTNVAERQNLLSKIKSQFGYGGAIHNFKNYVLRGTDKHHGRVKKHFGDLYSTIDRYRQLAGITDEEEKALQTIRQVAQQYAQAVDTVKRLHQEGKSVKEIDKTVKINDGPAVKALNTLASYQQNLTEQHTLSLDSQISHSQNMLLITILVAVAIVLAFIIILSQSILRPLSTLQQSMQKAESQSDLSIKTNLKGNDEIAQIGHAFDQMMETFRSIMQQINQSAERLTQESSSLATITEQSSADIANQQEQTYEVAKSITQIDQAVTGVANSLSSTSSTASTTSHETSQSHQLLQKTIDSIEMLSQQIHQSTKVIHQLDANSEKINSVVDVIRGIAEQTNLLALNAAIEAARAGEQGRGFAVVADEVRTLAGRTQESTEEINQMVSQLQSDTDNAVKSMEASSKQASLVVDQATQAGDSLNTISVSIDDINVQSIDVANMTTQQSEMLNSITHNINQINEMSMQTAKGAQLTTSSSESLRQLADDLKQTANQFKT